MAYEILMPQLSDAMDEGKLIAWKVKEGDHVKKGDVIAEVESDKAIMEVQSFQDGVVETLAIQEGESVAVGKPIATINTDTILAPEKEPEKKSVVVEKSKEVKSEPTPKEPHHDTPLPKAQEGDASAKAKVLATDYHLDITALQNKGKLPTPAHEADIKEYYLQRYFTPKALQLLNAYRLDSSLFEKSKKHDSHDILVYIKAHNTPRYQPLDSFQKSLIHTVEASAKKPIYHIYDKIDASLMRSHKEHTMTVWLIKLFAKAMMEHEAFRSKLVDETIMIRPNASISLAIAHGSKLYMPVFEAVNLLLPQEIDKQLKIYKEKAKNASMQPKEMQGASFGISNLGMLGIERFDAMINQDECGIAAIGGVVDGSIMITLTLDHRLINGYQGAEFMQRVKSLAKDMQFFKE